MRWNKEVLIIPGLGKYKAFYRLVALLWRLQGYRARLFDFDWEKPGDHYHKTFRELERRVATYPGTVAVIGASAGGVVALHTGLLHPEKIHKVVTISSPLIWQGTIQNHTLRPAIDALAPALSRADSDFLHTKTLSLFGLEDKIVPLERSQVAGMPQQQLPVRGHGMIIFAALTWRNAVIRRYLNS